jgi:glycosyltransferase involved in cell wall biosynthesis
MKVLFFLKYDITQASARVRGFYIAEELRKMGVACDIVYGLGRYTRSFPALARHDIIFFHRCYFTVDIMLNALVRGMGKKTVFDIDDAPGGLNLSQRKERNANTMMKGCSAVTIGSHALKSLAERQTSHAYLIPSSIALPYYQPPEKRKKSGGTVTLGWIGHGINYKHDLFTLLKPLENLSKRHKIKLILAGALGDKELYEKFGAIKNMELEIVDWLSWKDPHAVPAVISQFDIGLYPLLDREYNRYKCSFKGLEYLAMEVPVVASPVGENNIAFEAGKDGFLPSNEREWEECIARLIEDTALRTTMGMNGRKKIEERYSTRVCARRLLDVFETIMK